MMKDFYVYVDKNFPRIRELYCDRCSEKLSDFWAWFYETEDNEVILSRFYCENCKNKSVKDTQRLEPERQILLMTYEEAPQGFKEAIKEIVFSKPQILELSSEEFQLLVENPFLLRFWK